MVDVFEEVEEQLRADRYQTIIKKGWPYAVAAVAAALLATGGVWGFREYQKSQSDKASQTYEQAFEALNRNDRAGAEKAFAEVAASGPKAYRALALMQQAGLRTTDNKTAEAVSLFDQAAKVAPDPIIGDLASLKAAYVLFDTASLSDLEARLTPLTAKGRPYISLAREALAVKRLASGQVQQAKDTFAVLAISPDASEGLQARAQAAQVVIDSGQAGVLAAAAKAAAAIPPAQVQQAMAKAAQEALAAQAAQARLQAAAQPQAGAPQ